MSSVSRERRTTGYVHGFTSEEQERLSRQARYLEHHVHENLPLRRVRKLIEVGCGVGAQTEILLRRWPDLHVTGVDASGPNLERARANLSSREWLAGRWELSQQDAARMSFAADTFDGAFVCWLLEHVADAAQILAEVRRVLRPGSPVVITEVQNASFFIDPYSPHTLAYWMAFNDHQLELGGDPFVGAKLGNLLLTGGFRDIETRVHTIHLDNRAPGEREEFLAYWSELLLSGAEGLLEADKVEPDTVRGMEEELDAVAHDPDAVFFYSFVQARARVW